MESFEGWIERQYRYCAHAMLAGISAVDLVKHRPGFGQSVRAKRGSIVASPVLAAYDPDPDYFFHWYRDSAVVIDALRLLYDGGDVGAETLATLADFIQFSSSLQGLEGQALVASGSWRRAVIPDFVKFLRSETELSQVRGDAVAADTRVNPDGSLDISSWARPQFDGPPLRALCLLRWIRSAAPQAELNAAIAALIRSDLEFAAAHWREPSFDIWEEERGRHYYTLSVCAAALEEGAGWLEPAGDVRLAHRYRTTSEEVWRELDGFWLADAGHYRSRILADGTRSTKELDIAVVLAAIHTQRTGNRHSVHDPRMQATLDRLERLFGEAYSINQPSAGARPVAGESPSARERPAAGKPVPAPTYRPGPAMGRYAGDVYYSGGAYYFSTLGAAEFCFRAALGGRDSQAWTQRGDAYLATVRAFTPPGGELSEQFDRNTGLQTSAKHLAWSYAALISCVTARRQVIPQQRNASA